MTELDYRAWWEKGVSPSDILSQIKKHPRAVARQIGVALDMAQAPLGSDQETFPTLEPSQAEELIKQKSK